MSDYQGCPTCGAYDDQDCTCVRSDYELVPHPEDVPVMVFGVDGCSCGRYYPCDAHGWENAPPGLRPLRVVPFDFATWGDRPEPRYQSEDSRRDLHLDNGENLA